MYVAAPEGHTGKSVIALGVLDTVLREVESVGVFRPLVRAGERDGILDRLVAEKKRGKPQVTRFKGLGEMNPPQLRETTMDPNTRRLVQLTLDDVEATAEIMDMLLAKKRAGDRREWLEEKGNLAII